MSKILEQIYNLKKQGLLSQDDLEKQLINRKDEILGEITGFQKLEAELIEGKEMQFLLGFGRSFFGVIAKDFRDCSKILEDGKTPVLVSHYLFPQKEVNNYVSPFLPYINHHMMSHRFQSNFLLVEEGYYKKFHEKYTELMDYISNFGKRGEKVNQTDPKVIEYNTVSDQVSEYKASLLEQFNLGDEVFVDMPQKKLYVGKLKLIENDDSFYRANSELNYLKLYEELFDKNVVSSNVCANIGNKDYFDKSLQLGLESGIFKTDWMYYGGNSLGKNDGYLGRALFLLNYEPSKEPHEKELSKCIAECLKKYDKDKIRIRYIDFFAPEHDGVVTKLQVNPRESLELRLSVFEIQTKAIAEALINTGYRGKVEVCAPNIFSCDEAEKIYQMFDKVLRNNYKQLYDKKNNSFCIEFTCKIETLEAAREIEKIAKKFNLMFEFGDLAARYYGIDRGDVGSINAFEKNHGFNPLKNTSKDKKFVEYTEGLVKKALGANPNCVITFGGDQLNQDPALAKLAVKYGIDICITPNEQNHAAALFNLKIAALERKIELDKHLGKGSSSKPSANRF